MGTARNNAADPREIDFVNRIGDAANGRNENGTNSRLKVWIFDQRKLTLIKLAGKANDRKNVNDTHGNCRQSK